MVDLCKDCDFEDTEGVDVFEAYLSISRKGVRNDMYWVKDLNHWMPLPEPPKED